MSWRNDERMRRDLRRSAADEERERAVPSLALTLWQPWATTVMVGPKGVENRGWPPPRFLIGQRIWIHAGKTFDEDAVAFVRRHWPELPSGLPGGVLLGSVRVLGALSDSGRRLGEFDAPGVKASLWFFGPWGWVLGDPRPLERPISCRGAQGLWRLPSELRAALLIGHRHRAAAAARAAREGESP